MEPVTRAELRKRLQAGTVTVIDVRPEEEFALCHIQGAANIPIGELKRRLSGLPRGKEIVAYCPGPYCVFAVEAVAVLRAAGFKAGLRMACRNGGLRGSPWGPALRADAEAAAGMKFSARRPSAILGKKLNFPRMVLKAGQLSA